MRRKQRKQITQTKTTQLSEPIDLSKYTIIETDIFPKIYRQYFGTIGDCILEFEKKYGIITGCIYVRQKVSGCVVGVTGPQVKNNNGETE